MLNYLIRKANQLRAETIVKRIEPYIKNSNKLIDIGSGTGYVASILKREGKDITPVDVDSFRGLRLIKPIIYDGKKLPFPDKSFGTGLLLMVLHHTPDPSTVFSEAARVARDIVVIETSYKNCIEKCITVIADTISNLQTKANWDSYKTDSEWKEFFMNKGFRIVDSHHYKDYNIGVPFLHILYYLKKF